MKNLLTGWITTVLGLILMVGGTLDFFGVIDIPAPEGMTEFHQVTVAFITGIVLFLVPRSSLEEAATKILTKKTDV